MRILRVFLGVGMIFGVAVCLWLALVAVRNHRVADLVEEIEALDVGARPLEPALKRPDGKATGQQLRTYADIQFYGSLGTAGLLLVGGVWMLTRRPPPPKDA